MFLAQKRNSNYNIFCNESAHLKITACYGSIISYGADGRRKAGFEARRLAGWITASSRAKERVCGKQILSGDATCLSLTVILILIFQHFFHPLRASLKVFFTEAGPLTLSEEGACQLLPEKEGSSPGKGWALLVHTPGPGLAASREPGQEGAAF